MADAESGPESAVRKLVGSFGVTGYIMLNKNGIPVQQHGMDDDRAVQVTSLSFLFSASSAFLRLAAFQLASPIQELLVRDCHISLGNFS